MLKKSVNGVEVIMSDEEEAAIRAEWAANAAKPIPDPFDSLVKSDILVDALIQELAVRLGITEIVFKDSLKTRLIADSKI